ncbi:hypothetical protein QQX98_005871 [Neonectria punicea]|uniref:Uncharacterized protein n=1 Tax=Neonectria punicea TaxID=979145 RepID=A0ABR1H3Q6_9HYPO
MIERVHKQEQPSAPYLQRIARWRAQGSSLLDELWKCDENLFEDLIQDETDRLKPFWSGSSTTCETMVKDQVRGILQCAVELDQLMMVSKAIFYLRWDKDLQEPNGQLEFDSETMEAVALTSPISDRSLVCYFVSPILCKVGNADGQNYDSRMVLAKAKVVCN